MDWQRKQLWTLIEAAYLLAGMEPQPADRFDKNLVSGGLPAEIYDHLKDAVDLRQIAYVESRNANISGRRVKPADALAWYRHLGYAVPPELIELPQPPKPLTTRERDTLLIIIAALCDYSAIEPERRGTAIQIAKMTEEIGAPVTDDTIRKVLAKISEAVAARKK